MPVLPFTLYHRRRSWIWKNHRRQIVFHAVIVLAVVVLALVIVGDFQDCIPRSVVKRYDKAFAFHTNVVIGRDGNVFKYDRSSPLIFISGVNLSGSDYLRDVLNYHPDIRCSSDRQFIPKMLRMRANWDNSKNESLRLREGGMSPRLLNTALGAFVLEVMARSGEPAKYLCSEDFHSLKYADQLTTIFPQSKFLLVVRDPLHYAHSKMLDQNLTVFNETLFNEHIDKWDKEMQHFIDQCHSLIMWDPRRCLILHYELLYLFPRKVVQLVLEFIFAKTNKNHSDIPETMIPKLARGKHENLTEWVKHVPKSAIRSLGRKMMMKYEVVDKMGYGQIGHPPNYTLLQWMG